MHLDAINFPQLRLSPPRLGAGGAVVDLTGCSPSLHSKPKGVNRNPKKRRSSTLKDENIGSRAPVSADQLRRVLGDQYLVKLEDINKVQDQVGHRKYAAPPDVEATLAYTQAGADTRVRSETPHPQRPTFAEHAPSAHTAPPSKLYPFEDAYLDFTHSQSLDETSIARYPLPHSSQAVLVETTKTNRNDTHFIPIPRHAGPQLHMSTETGELLYEVETQYLDYAPVAAAESRFQPVRTVRDVDGEYLYGLEPLTYKRNRFDSTLPLSEYSRPSTYPVVVIEQEEDELLSTGYRSRPAAMAHFPPAGTNVRGGSFEDELHHGGRSYG